MKNAAGRIVSKKKHEAGRAALKFLHAKGYIAVKGKFGCKKAASNEDAPAITTTPTVSNEGGSATDSAVAAVVVEATA